MYSFIYNQKLLGETEGVLALLMAASHYKRKDPQVTCTYIIEICAYI